MFFLCVFFFPNGHWESTVNYSVSLYLALMLCAWNSSSQSVATWLCSHWWNRWNWNEAEWSYVNFTSTQFWSQPYLYIKSVSFHLLKQCKLSDRILLWRVGTLLHYLHIFDWYMMDLIRNQTGPCLIKSHFICLMFYVLTCRNSWRPQWTWQIC